MGRALPPSCTYISATIWVEKESQKGIVIGERGSMLKKVGQSARKEIESVGWTSSLSRAHGQSPRKVRRDEWLLQEPDIKESGQPATHP